jgi:hypothetical protein
MQEAAPRKIEQDEVFKFEFSICTLVTNMAEYLEMQASFLNSGFTAPTCEYLYIDNSKSNTYEAYAGLNRFLREAQGRYIILCHQDILITHHDINDLRAKMDEVERADPRWAILSNAGGVNLKYTAMNIIQGNGNLLADKHLPIRTITVDENFILVKHAANLALSVDLHGFHMYGTDICLIADVLGYSSYAIDFKLVHKSDGNADKAFYAQKKALIKKYRKAFRSRFLGTTITRFYLSGNRAFNFLGNTLIVLFIARQYYKIFRPKKGYRLKTKD